MKSRFFLFVSGMLCLAALSACQRELVEPGESNSTREVLTGFVFNISTAAGQQTKQSAADVQADGDNFHGIADAKLLAYAEGDDLDGKILVADKTAPKFYDLSSLISSSAATSEARRVLEMSLPLKTNIMLLYGRMARPAYTPATGSFININDKYGKLDKYEVTNLAGSANFQLGKRLEDADRYYITEQLLAGILTAIMNTSLSEAIKIQSGDLENGVAYGYTITSGLGGITWKSYDNTDKNSPYEAGHALYPMEERMQYLYHQMVTIRSDLNELRAASGEDILRIVSDLWSGINAVRSCEPISEAEAVAKKLAATVNAHLAFYFASGDTGVTFNGLDEVITRFQSDSYWPADPTGEGIADADKASKQKPTSTQLSKLTDAPAISLASFPFNFNMPRGVSYMAFNTTGSFFYYPQIFNTSDVSGDPSNSTDPTAGTNYDANSYYYPAEILYFGNSPVRVSDVEHAKSYYNSIADWNTETNWPTDDWSGSHVVSTTKSVAMKYNINYGVAMLKTTVGYKSGISYLEDNNHAVQALAAGYSTVDAYNEAGHTNDEPNKHIAITATSFKLTGIIIGGQPQNVGWDFLPIKANSTDATITTGFIYDRAVYNQTIPTTGASDPNYTVVFDNYNASAVSATSSQDKVFVALEFQNCTGEDFYGNCNLVRDNGYFYLIGALDVGAITENSTNDIDWNHNGYVIPPYKADGTSKEVRRIFVQDYVTDVTFKFGQNSLKYAYLTVPDLRSSSLTMGLSVDINWSKGLKYDEIIMGGN